MHQFQTHSHKKANISILVIFVLLASALFSLLAIIQLRTLMTYGSTVHNFFRAYYLSKGGLELALTEVSIRYPGFEIKSVTSGSLIVQSNLLSGFKAREPSWGWTMKATTTKLEKDLIPGESITIPMYIDNEKSHIGALGNQMNNIKYFTDVNDNVSKLNIRIEGLQSTDTENDVLYSFYAYSGENLSIIDEVSFTQNGTLDSNGKLDISQITGSLDKIKTMNNKKITSYLVILNQSSDTGYLVITWDQPFALWETTIVSQGHYGDTDVGLKATFNETPPDWTISNNRYTNN